MKTSVHQRMAARPRVRAMMFMFLVAAMVMTLHAPALALTQVNLHGPHVGASSETFNTESDAGGLTDAVVWHFILNGLDHGAPAGTIYVTFASAGAKTATGIPVGIGATQHYYVGTPTHDTIVSAYAMVDSVGYVNLVLSHVALNQVEEPPVEEPPVEEPPVEEPPVEEPPIEEPPVEEPPVIPPLDDDPFLPFTEEPVSENEPVVTIETMEKEESEPFLPFTGMDFGLLSALVAASAGIGSGLRKLAMRQ